MEGNVIKLPVLSPDLLTIRQAAKELGVHLATAYRWVERGKLYTFRFGDQVFVHMDQVRELKEKKEIGSED